MYILSDANKKSILETDWLCVAWAQQQSNNSRENEEEEEKIIRWKNKQSQANARDETKSMAFVCALKLLNDKKNGISNSKAWLNLKEFPIHNVNNNEI